MEVAGKEVSTLNLLKYRNEKKIMKEPDYHSFLTPRLINDLSVVNIEDDRICVTADKNRYGLYKVQFRIPNGISQETTSANKAMLIRLLDKMESKIKVIMLEELNNSLYDNILDYQQMMLIELEKENPDQNFVEGLSDRINIMRQLELEKKLVQLVFVDADYMNLFEVEAQHCLSYQRLVKGDLIQMLSRLNNGVND